MTGVAIATGLAAVATGVGAYLNYKGQQKANQTNQDLAREQMSYQTSERLATQQYNTPEAQRARFEAAGINPYLAISNLDAGNTQAMSAPGFSPVENEGLGDVLSQLGQAPEKVISSVQGVQQIQAQKEAVKQARIESLYKERNIIAELQNKQADTKLKLAGKDLSEAQKKVLAQQERDLAHQIRMHEIDADYHEQYVKSRNSKEENLARLAYEQQVGQYLQNNYQQQVNDAFPALNAAQIQSLKAQTSQAYAAANLSNKMSETEIEKKAEQITRNQIATLERDGWQKNRDAEIALKRANKIYIQAATSKVRKTNNWVQNYSPLAGLAVAAVK